MDQLRLSHFVPVDHRFFVFPERDLRGAKEKTRSFFDHENGLRTQHQSAVCSEVPSLQMELVVVSLEFQDREVFTFCITPTMVDAIW